MWCKYLITLKRTSYFLATLLMSFLKEAVHLVRCNLTQSDSSNVAFGVNFSLGVTRRLLQSVPRSEEKPESLPKPLKPWGALLISKFCDVDELSDEQSSMYEMARSPKGTLTEEHSLVDVDAHDGRKNSDRLSVSSPDGLDECFILLRRSWNGVCRHENNLWLKQKRVKYYTFSIIN